MKTSCKTFIVKFKNEIEFYQIPFFRGAILRIIGQDAELLYHNHIGERKYRYSYPLIQYKRIHKKAAIFCIGEGVDVIGQYLSADKFEVHLGDNATLLEVETVVPHKTTVQLWDSVFKYNLNRWLALNTENYIKYQSIEDISERIQFLENILIGNLLSFAKGLGIEISSTIICKLLSLSDPFFVTVKGVKMMAFNLKFKSNISLPNYMGLGKHASFGYGTITRIYNENK